jgi:DNA (cytosine-5)-methyltransferase 1
MNTIRYGSVCTGISAETAAWKSLGWNPVFFSEIEPFPCSVLATHYPDVPNRGDMTKYDEWPNDTIDLLTGGTPCQDFSIAGLRAGMDAPRGNLSLTYVAIAAKYRPRWLVWENVCGLFSSNGGLDFARFLGALTGRIIQVPADGWGDSGAISGIADAYGVAWRVLDAQYVCVDSHARAVPQRRNRVFVVGHIGGCWQRAAAVLLECESLRGDSAPRRTAGQGTAYSVAPCIGASGRGFERAGETRGQDPVVAVETGIAHSLRAEGFDASEDGTGRGTPLVPERERALTTSNQRMDAETDTLLPVAFDTTQVTSKANRSNPKPGDPCHPLASGAHAPAVAFTQNQMGDVLTGDAMHSLGTNQNSTGRNAPNVAIGIDPQLNADVESIGSLNTGSRSGGGQPSRVSTRMAVRRLTPRECERLMGHADDYTAIPHRGKPAADGPRYKALGNGQCVNVMRWIGQRIQQLEEIHG